MEITYPCWRCGKPIAIDDEPSMRVYCDECRILDEKERDELIAEHSRIRRLVMFDTAIMKMESANGVYMHEYREIAINVKERIITGMVDFKSADEIMAAMVLESYNVPYEANKTINRSVVDFYIPSMHVCLEIDGDRHKWTTTKDYKRDVEIRNTLGPEWEVIHIPTARLEERPERLVDAIEALFKEKKRLRRENHGFLPETYSFRERDYYETLVPTRKEYVGR